MKNNVGTVPAPVRGLVSLFVVVLLLTTTVLFSACASQSTGAPTVTNTSAASSTANGNTGQIPSTLVPSATVGGGYPVKIYFSKVDSTNFTDVVAKDRISPTIQVATFAVEQIIAGPDQTEQNQGLFSQLHDSITGPSNCEGQNAVGGSDFLLTLNKKGTVDEQGTATLQFCRDLDSPGVGSDARIIMEITTTLKQFSSIQKVVILRKDGHCFGDGSGRDMCLN